MIFDTSSADQVYTIAAQDVPWGIVRVDVDVVHEESETGDGADIAIIDMGIDRTHADLEPNLGEGAAFTGGTKHDQWQDDNGHGTHCAGQSRTPLRGIQWTDQHECGP